MANRARQIRESILQQYPDAEVIERGRNYLKLALPNGRKVITSTIGRLHLDDGTEIDTTLAASPDPNFDDESGDALPYRVRVRDGNRRVWPRRDVPGEFIDLGRPEFQRPNGTYAVIPWDRRERIDNTVIFRRNDAELHVTVGAERLKMDLVLLSQPARSTWRFPVSLTGLSRQGTQIVSDSDGAVVMHVAPFTMVDAAGVESDVAGTFTAHPSYQGAYRISPDLTGAAYPARIDPTVTVDVTTGADDGYFNQSSSFLTAIVLNLGWVTSSFYNCRVFMRFTDVTVPAGATIDAAWFDAVRSGGGGSGDLETIAYLNDVGDASNPADGAAFDSADRTTGVTFIAGSVGVGSVDSSASLVADVQAVVGRGDWASGNAMMVLWQPTVTTWPGSQRQRQFAPYEHATYAPPALHIEYTEGGGTPTIVDGTATLTHSATLTATGEAIEPPPTIVDGTAALTHTATLSAAATVVTGGAASLTHAPMLTATATTIAVGTATLTHAPTLSATATVVTSGTAALTHAPTITATGTVIADATATLAHTATLQATGDVVVSGAASLTHAPQMDAQGVVVTDGTASLTHSATLEATGEAVEPPAGVVSGTASLTHAPTLSATGSVIAEGSASLSHEPTLTASPLVVVSGAASLSHLPELVATGVVIVDSTADLTHAPTLTAAGVVVVDATATLTHSATLTATGTTGVIVRIPRIVELVGNVGERGGLVGSERSVTLTGSISEGE